jgi:uncharacterized membrane-anchored protein
MKRREVLVIVGLVLAIGVPTYAIVQKERVLSAGTTMLLELAPVDPRSLIQGDYMRLDYAITSDWRSGRSMPAERARTWPRDGHIVVTLDSAGVARFVRRHEAGIPLAGGERLLQYRRRGGRVRVGTDAFYFQEGQARRYEGARYGELRVDASGGSVLVGLRDRNGRPL